MGFIVIVLISEINQVQQKKGLLVDQIKIQSQSYIYKTFLFKYKHILVY